MPGVFAREIFQDDLFQLPPIVFGGQLFQGDLFQHDVFQVTLGGLFQTGLFQPSVFQLASPAIPNNRGVAFYVHNVTDATSEIVADSAEGWVPKGGVSHPTPSISLAVHYLPDGFDQDPSATNSTLTSIRWGAWGMEIKSDPSIPSNGGDVLWAEMEVPPQARRGVLTWAEVEVPSGRRGVVTFVELEVPLGARAGRATWAEMETPTAGRRGIATWAEVEVPTRTRQGVVTWAEMQVPTANRYGHLTFAEMQVPLSSRGRITWAVFMTLDVGDDGNRAGRIQWLEFTVPTRGQLFPSSVDNEGPADRWHRQDVHTW